MDHFTYKDGVLHAEDVPLSAIAAAVGTPVYVYSRATLERHVAVFRAGLSGLDDPLIAYSVKANPNGALLAVLARQGVGADVVSAGELLRAVNAGIPAGKIVFSGVGKTAEEMRIALDHDIYQFNLESEQEAEMLSAIAAGMATTAAATAVMPPVIMA